MFQEKISIAPMLDCTDRHFRYLMRLITKKAWLYTEMLTVQEVLHKKEMALKFAEIEHPISIQLGGSDPDLLAKCTKLAVAAKFDEVNLNVGCPSSRAQSGTIGACLMLDPKLVAKCVSAMVKASSVPITVKCRTGVDQQDSYPELARFIEHVSAAGCQKFIIHARKAWLKGLNPKQNREIPPLNYETVYRLKADFPELTFILNGGLKEILEMTKQLEWVDGVMVGRAAYNNPYLLSQIDSSVYGLIEENLSEEAVLEQYINYMDDELKEGTRMTAMSKHLLGLFHGRPGAGYWRKYLSLNCHKHGADTNVIREALAEFKQWQ